MNYRREEKWRDFAIAVRAEVATRPGLHNLPTHYPSLGLLLPPLDQLCV